MSPKQDKKQIILQSALNLFGDYGLNGTSVRMIAKEAKVNIASIAYYFNSKENLYLEIAKYIANQISDYMKPFEAEIEASLKNPDISKNEALSVVQLMMRKMAEMFFTSESPKAWSKIIVREQAKPTKAFDIIYESIMLPMQEAMAKAIAIYIDKPPQSDEVKIRLHALTGQVLAFLLCKESLIRHLQVKELNQSHIDLSYKILQIQIEGSLNCKVKT